MSSSALAHRGIMGDDCKDLSSSMADINDPSTPEDPSPTQEVPPIMEKFKSLSYLLQETSRNLGAMDHLLELLNVSKAIPATDEAIVKRSSSMDSVSAMTSPRWTHQQNAQVMEQLVTILKELTVSVKSVGNKVETFVQGKTVEAEAGGREVHVEASQGLIDVVQKMEQEIKLLRQDVYARKVPSPRVLDESSMELLKQLEMRLSGVHQHLKSLSPVKLQKQDAQEDTHKTRRKSIKRVPSKEKSLEYDDEEEVEEDPEELTDSEEAEAKEEPEDKEDRSDSGVCRKKSSRQNRTQSRKLKSHEKKSHRKHSAPSKEGWEECLPSGNQGEDGVQEVVEDGEVGKTREQSLMLRLEESLQLTLMTREELERAARRIHTLEGQLLSVSKDRDRTKKDADKSVNSLRQKNENLATRLEVKEDELQRKEEQQSTDKKELDSMREQIQKLQNRKRELESQVRIMEEEMSTSRSRQLQREGEWSREREQLLENIQSLMQINMSSDHPITKNEKYRTGVNKEQLAQLEEQHASELSAVQSTMRTLNGVVNEIQLRLTMAEDESKRLQLKLSEERCLNQSLQKLEALLRSRHQKLLTKLRSARESKERIQNRETRLRDSCSQQRQKAEHLQDALQHSYKLANILQDNYKKMLLSICEDIAVLMDLFYSHVYMGNPPAGKMEEERQVMVKSSSEESVNYLEARRRLRWLQDQIRLGGLEAWIRPTNQTVTERLLKEGIPAKSEELSGTVMTPEHLTASVKLIQDKYNRLQALMSTIKENTEQNDETEE